MKIKEETKIIEQKIITYVADDGTEFRTESECKDYEVKQFSKYLIEAAEKLRIPELDEYLPLSNDGLMNENNTFRWYKLNNETDFEIVNKAYGNSLNTPESYPEVMCVETVGDEAYMDYAYNYNMETCKKITENFWKELGVKVTFENIAQNDDSIWKWRI